MIPVRRATHKISRDAAKLLPAKTKNRGEMLGGVFCIWSTPAISASHKAA